MKADPHGVLTGTHFIDGDHACCEGALAAGASFAAGYPITPSTEVVERFAARVPTVGGTFIQMEDELAASITLQGAVWGGAKAFTVTSGPGFSLMMEHIGYAAMTETPCVFVDVQRGGPSTGLPTLPAQADMMQARWGSHGDYEIIALCPNSPQECFDLTIKAFNLAEEFRVPVMFMMDEVVGHMTEKVVIPPADQIEVMPRKHTRKSVEDYLPYGTNGDMVPEMAHAGEGYKFHVTGLTHDERGYPNMTPQTQDKLVRRLQNKIRTAADRICLFEEDGIDGADVVVVSYGITSRVAQRADRDGSRTRPESRQASPDHSLALPGQEDCRNGGESESLGRPRTQSRADGARSGTRRTGQSENHSRYPMRAAESTIQTRSSTPSWRQADAEYYR